MSRLEELLKFDVDIKEMSRECDRCGKELKYGNKEIQTISCQGPVFYVCEDCKNKIVKFIKNPHSYAEIRETESRFKKSED